MTLSHLVFRMHAVQRTTITCNNKRDRHITWTAGFVTSSPRLQRRSHGAHPLFSIFGFDECRVDFRHIVALHPSDDMLALQVTRCIAAQLGCTIKITESKSHTWSLTYRRGIRYSCWHVADLTAAHFIRAPINRAENYMPCVISQTDGARFAVQTNMTIINIIAVRCVWNATIYRMTDWAAIRNWGDLVYGA